MKHTIRLSFDDIEMRGTVDRAVHVVCSLLYLLKCKKFPVDVISTSPMSNQEVALYYAKELEKCGIRVQVDQETSS